MVDDVARAYEVPRDLPFLLILAILATSVGGRIRVRVAPDWTEVLSIYSAVAVPSGERKSPVLNALSAPLRELETRLAEDAAPDVVIQRALRDMRQSAVEKIKRTGDTSSTGIANLEGAVRELESTVVPPIPRLLADDSTPEAMAKLMAEQGGRLGVLSAEGGLFATLAGRYSSGVANADLVLKSWSGDFCRVDRVSREPLTLAEPVLSIGLAVQPGLLASLSESKSFRYTGLLARFLFALPTSLVGGRSSRTVPVAEVVASEYAGKIGHLIDTTWRREVAQEIGISEAARKVLDDYRDELEPRLHPEVGDLAHIADWANKLPGQLVRVAALMSLFEHPDTAEIAETEMRDAIDLAPYFVSHAVAAFDLMSGRRSPLEPARAVLTWLRRKGLTEFTVRQAWRDLSGQVWATATEDVREALADLDDLGWIALRVNDAPRRRGRPTEIYDVNPEALR
ncbi:YfjI family protein [Umezawaea sp. Da 62-37]|uniref:YfjI family protein n=1 Tax=Umezawaea sp. Da 62-37 TaxID=3075927 RepID=UPI0028F6FBC9|nr:YfjI family protein [Umezawaea sp. Da 62-37]WNV89021.1 YfjI family protein [Umezawaea sp. Da 62-37]